MKKEWVITNGIGGYAGSSIDCANTRKHHGVFIASLYAPTDRKVLVNRVCEKVVFEDREICLYSGKKKGGFEERGYIYETEFEMDSVPVFKYSANEMKIEKSIAFEWEKNTVALLYKVTNQGPKGILSLTPIYNYRDHNAGSFKKDLKFSVNVGESGNVDLTPKANENLTIHTYVSEGHIYRNDTKNAYDTDIELQTEIDTGMSSSDTGFSPVSIEIGVGEKEEKTISLVFSIEEAFCRDAEKTIAAAKERDRILIKNANVKDDFLKTLVVSADKFVVKRASTGGKTILAGLPWFTDWGRDTMIAFSGLTLVTGRFEDAKSILETFVKYEKNGLLPNMFPDRDCDPIYNTADASLWFFFCVYQYLKYTEDYGFVRDTLYPCMKRIIDAYMTGTGFSIGMDEDGLIHAGSKLDQVTWMDVRVGDRVMTPRHGKPVEINALWYNALCITSALSDRFGDNSYSEKLRRQAEITAASFETRFWNEEKDCLYDVVDEIPLSGGPAFDNGQIRPNQIWAVSLPYTALSKEHMEKIVKTVFDKLYAKYGLRTLDTQDPDYHGLYKGDLAKRDEAYHQGTSWAFLLGGFITAYLKVWPEKKNEAAELLKPIKQHLHDGCINGIAEVFDGDEPHISGGCYTQAWSVGEVLRAVYEGNLKV